MDDLLQNLMERLEEQAATNRTMAEIHQALAESLRDVRATQRHHSEALAKIALILEKLIDQRPTAS